jgi:hypothetical protein
LASTILHQIPNLPIKKYTPRVLECFHVVTENVSRFGGYSESENPNLKSIL